MKNIKFMDKTIQTYDRIAKDFAGLHKNTKWQEEFNYFSELVKGKKVIDIGCGHGREAILFLNKGFDYLGIDASKSMLQEAKKIASKGKFVLMDFYNLKFPKESFDGFWAASSLLHIPKGKVSGVLGQIRRILKKDGVGFVSLKERKNLDEGMIKEDQYGGSERFFAFYELEEFGRILLENGFEIIKKYRLKQEDNGKIKDMLCYFVRKE